MRHLLILAVLMCAGICLAEEIVREYTWTQTNILQPGQTLDVVAVTPDTCTDAWLISDKPVWQGEMKTCGISWCKQSSKCTITALEVTTVTLYGK